MHSYYTFMALDLARDRAREADQRRLLTIDRASNQSDRSIRKSAASAFAAFSRASGRLARRLDDNVAVSSALIGRSTAGCNCADAHS